MIDPCTLLPYPSCKGSGRTGESCPHSPDTDVNCEECSIKCNTETDCTECDGRGEVSEKEYRGILNEMES
jgi:hypothetical protein